MNMNVLSMNKLFCGSEQLRYQRWCEVRTTNLFRTNLFGANLCHAVRTYPVRTISGEIPQAKEAKRKFQPAIAFICTSDAGEL